jgi:catechol 2,3-dioxygenase-like lactoylglutathione lyase family enzyme
MNGFWIMGLDHVQLAMPRGGEGEAREFYGRLLGLPELPKPAVLASRGGAWFALPDGRQLHLGVEEPFRPNRKAHPAFLVSDLDALARATESEGRPVGWDDALAPEYRRFYGEDPFGNRVEFLQAVG